MSPNSHSVPACPPLAVLNPEGHDPFLDFRNGPSPFQPGSHPPINFHAFAACSRGAFCQHTSDVFNSDPGRFRHVLLLLRKRIGPCLQAMRSLRAAGLPVLVSWKECGFAQINAQLSDPSPWRDFSEILSLAQGVISPTASPFPLPPALPSLPFHVLPTPYPVDLADWNYSIPPAERSGIFLGTREFFQPSRNHLSALMIALRVAKQTHSHVTVINAEKRRGERLLRALVKGLPGDCFRILEGKLPYDAYLRLIARHRVVFQLDRSLVPGQVAGDALLCRSVCLGGNSTIEQIAFPNLCAPFLPDTDMEPQLAALLTDSRLLEESIAASQAIAREKLSFAAGAQKLSSLLGAIPSA